MKGILFCEFITESRTPISLGTKGGLVTSYIPCVVVCMSFYAVAPFEGEEEEKEERME